MVHPTPGLPWRTIPSSHSKSTCKVHLLQAGGLILPNDLVLLPDPDGQNTSLELSGTKNEPGFYVPDYCFLIHHPPTDKHYIFDLGMRKDLENLPPYLVKHVLPSFDCTPRSPADILREHGTPEQQPENVKAVIFSHMHFDHVGDGGKVGFTNTELWVGPTCCTYARPGYPVEENAPTLSETLPTDGSKKIVEAFVSDALFKKAHDKRIGMVANAKKEGLYEAVELHDPGDDGWIGLGAFDRAFDVWGDGSAYLLDAPGHSPGHQMMLIRVKINASGDDDFVLLAGDCYHHPVLLRDPQRTARPPYSKGGMHADPKEAIVTMTRAKAFSEKDNVWVLGAHDFSVGEAIAPGEKEIKGLVPLNEWREKNWKKV
jgi:glyoxylase-like metal-dependent hydrolase (beta-lactamase superfamily II)